MADIADADPATTAAAKQAAALAAASKLFTSDNTLGALVVGFAASCVVFGVLLTQAWTYFGKYNFDGVSYKSLVVIIILLEAVDQAFIGHFVYFYTVTEAGRPFALITGTMTWSIIMQQALGSVVGTIVKCCFATRVWRFSERNIYITGFIVLLSFGQLGAALIFTVKAFALRNVPGVFSLKTFATISLALGALTDLVTAAALFHFLRRLRTGYSATDSLVRRLVRDAINTGVFTSAASVSTLLLFNLMPTNLVFAATYFMLAKLYGISLLATLNTRRAVRGRGTDNEASRSGSGTALSGGLRIKSARERAQEETNMFHLGTRMPTMYEDFGGGAPHRDAWDDDGDVKAPLPPPPPRAYERQWI
ncbi:hypothetical protein B0H15DRAFT_918122 [Mycena belliarum]|uniref:DUF6534 domain-containing protein n=1 Tax=Mycena belliarum TaxID=1033014 RepID=A0AAD6TM14_9AGAR|nr:hypothetical protein B0H15DRAFT_918122 [Mycena belliae]